METKNIFIIFGILIIVISFFYVFAKSSASMYVNSNQNDSPYYIISKPIVVKNILLPKGTKITYIKRYFWEKHQQKELLNEKDITDVSFKEGITIEWGGVPITEIIRFFNPEMKGFTVYADFNKLKENKETQFSNLWLSCNSDLSLTIKNTNDWSFNKKNILDIESCGANYQRYFTVKIKQQKFLDNLYNELIKIEN
ncbi:hypothetical protein [Aureibaculum luteum]|uniref:hypothetical protein n=1 Tax=Aureibaculum luteum TaxID=1548456 RepID=UPI0018E5643C|nr:hypothetical protein [Aureibaculum luteum]